MAEIDLSTAGQQTTQSKAPNVKTTYRIDPDPNGYPHIYWIELEDGYLHECAVLRRSPDGSLIFIKINHLDAVDKQRLVEFVVSRQARTVELWDLMAQRTLRNGMNALEYFHQLAKILTINGKVMEIRTGVAGLVKA